MFYFLFWDYTAQKIEYSGVQIFELEYDNLFRPAFHHVEAKSGKYDDVVCFVPVVTVDAHAFRTTTFLIQ